MGVVYRANCRKWARWYTEKNKRVVKSVSQSRESKISLFCDWLYTSMDVFTLLRYGFTLLQCGFTLLGVWNWFTLPKVSKLTVYFSQCRYIKREPLHCTGEFCHRLFLLPKKLFNIQPQSFYLTLSFNPPLILYSVAHLHNITFVNLSNFIFVAPWHGDPKTSTSFCGSFYCCQHFFTNLAPIASQAYT